MIRQWCLSLGDSILIKFSMNVSNAPPWLDPWQFYSIDPPTPNKKENVFKFKPIAIKQQVRAAKLSYKLRQFDKSLRNFYKILLKFTQKILRERNWAQTKRKLKQNKTLNLHWSNVKQTLNKILRSSGWIRCFILIFTKSSDYEIVQKTWHKTVA